MKITSRDPYAARAGRWIVCLLAAGAIGSAGLGAQRPSGSTSGKTQTGKAPAQSTAKPTPPPPAPPPPQVSVAGLKVVGAGLGANGSELHAFNERPGTTVALAIQAPAG